jgi:hypothetical protein
MTAHTIPRTPYILRASCGNTESQGVCYMGFAIALLGGAFWELAKVCFRLAGWIH